MLETLEDVRLGAKALVVRSVARSDGARGARRRTFRRPEPIAMPPRWAGSRSASGRSACTAATGADADRRELVGLDRRHADGGDRVARTRAAISRRRATPVSYRIRARAPNVSVTLTPTSATVVGAMSTAEPQQVALGAEHAALRRDRARPAGRTFRACPRSSRAWKDSSVTWITPTTAQAQALTIGRGRRARAPGRRSRAGRAALGRPSDRGDDLVRSGDARSRRDPRTVAERRSYRANDPKLGGLERLDESANRAEDLAAAAQGCPA